MNKPTFRAWDKNEEKWIDIKHLGYYDDGELWYLQSQAENGVDYDPLYFEYDLGGSWDLMQSTGLKDKNGVEIFEGDVVNLDVCNGFDNVNGKCVVQHSTGHSGLVCCHIRSGVEYRIFNNNFNYGYEYEVLGSIHENPELLNEVSGC